jgi:hypothetical protein
VVTWEYFVASEASCRGACTGGRGCRRWARRVSHRMAPACRPSSLGVVYGETARRRAHRDAGSTATVPRPPYAGLTRRRHVAGAAAARARRAGRGESAGWPCSKFVLPCF